MPQPPRQTDNPLLNYSVTPDFNKISEAEAQTAFSSVYKELAVTCNELAAAAPPGTVAEAWAQIYTKLINAMENVEQVWKHVEYMHSVNNTPFWNKLFNEHVTKTMAALDAVYHNQAVYTKLTELKKHSLTARQKLILQKFLYKFESLGAGLTGPAKAIFGQNRRRISELQSKFDDNLMAAAADPVNHTIVTAPADLGEMPEYVRAIYQTGADRWEFSASESSYKDLISYSPNRKLREEIYHKYHTRSSQYGPAQYNNLPIIEEIITLRQTQAKMVGYANHTARVFQTRMEKDPKKVTEFLTTLLKKSRPKAQKEITEIKQFARRTAGIKDLAPWDIDYMSRQLKQEKYGYREEELRDYFNADNVLAGLFNCAGNLFNLNFTPAELPKWHADIQYFMVADRATRTPLGYVRLDPFYRENKFDTAWMSQTTPRRADNITEQLPVINVSCNFPARKKDQPSQLNMFDIWVLFHEFGHALYNLTSKETDYNLNVEKTEADFVEMPSQFLENFMWEWNVIAPMTAHHKTGAPMPKELFDRAQAARNFSTGQFMARYLQHAFFDLDIHSSLTQNCQKIHQENKARCEAIKSPEYNMDTCCGFIHLFRNEESDIYAAGYYIYLWAQMYSSDAFALFKESGDVVNSELGRKLRQEVYETAAAHNSAEAYQKFAGRAPRLGPLLEHYGLAAAQHEHTREN